MKTLISLFLFLLSLTAHAVVLRPGDVLLQPLSCWSCRLIEAEENSIYSHMGLVLSVNPVRVAESLGKVRTLSLEEFNARTEKGQRLAVLRFRDPSLLEKLDRDQETFHRLFFENFYGRKYDHDFIWDNVDENGNELLYCSEMVTKLFDAFLSVTVPVKRMLFEKNSEEWETYFRGNVPRGKWGNSPGDFEKSALFEKIGEL